MAGTFTDGGVTDGALMEGTEGVEGIEGIDGVDGIEGVLTDGIDGVLNDGEFTGLFSEGVCPIRRLRNILPANAAGFY